MEPSPSSAQRCSDSGEGLEPYGVTNETPTNDTMRVGPRLAADPHPIPEDPKLPELAQLFDAEWVWGRYCAEVGAPDPEDVPDTLRLQHFQYRAGSRALVGYVSERHMDDWVVEDWFSFELRAGKPVRFYHFPDDPALPGLAKVASALDAHELIPKYVQLHPHRVHVETVRYRPGTRAVLRHIARFRRGAVPDVTLYARVMLPDRIDAYLIAGELAQRSGFVVPRLAGCWPEGGVVWLANTPGRTVRELIREGAAPAPAELLTGLADLWSAEAPTDAGQPLDLLELFRWTRRVLSQALPDGLEHPLLREVMKPLRRFCGDWRPTAIAHNDFYDDQVLQTPDGRLAVVDFEEIGPGDPLLDVGNLLAHLRWMGHFTTAKDRYQAYHDAVRAEALDRFRWDGRALDLREAYSLFRLASNPVRRVESDWLTTTESALALVAETLDAA